MGGDAAFAGAKLALFLGRKLAVILRDDTPGLLYAGYWDLPGGGREGGEGPLDCALRECREELGIAVPRAAVVWGRAFETPSGVKWFFAAHLPCSAASEVRLGDEGQRWDLMTPDDFLAHPKAVPDFQERLKIYLADGGQAHLTQKDPPLP